MDKLRFAFVGFRHGHIFGLLNAAAKHAQIELVAVCEEDAQTRADLAKSGQANVTHDNFARMLADVPCDIIAIGDYFGKRGSLAIAALQAGKHVIADKPLCTRLAELDKIQQLAQEKQLAVGLQLDMRSSGANLAARAVIASGELGQVHTVAFSGQHPLLWGHRPTWYFQDDNHGGTINDLFIHAADAVEWLTGRKISEVVAARAWNAKLPQAPRFQVGAQMMLRLDNNGGVLGDVSYLAPDKTGYSLPSYWRYTIHGDNGQLEWDAHGKNVFLTTHKDDRPRAIPVQADLAHVYLEDFLAQVRDPGANVSLTTQQVLRASRIALLTQQSADTTSQRVPCP
jgi:predicted dehydrogenase